MTTITTDLPDVIEFEGRKYRPTGFRLAKDGDKYLAADFRIYEGCAMSGYRMIVEELHPPVPEPPKPEYATLEITLNTDGAEVDWPGEEKAYLWDKQPGSVLNRWMLIGYGDELDYVSGQHSSFHPANPRTGVMRRFAYLVKVVPHE